MHPFYYLRAPKVESNEPVLANPCCVGIKERYRKPILPTVQDAIRPLVSDVTPGIESLIATDIVGNPPLS